MLKRLFSFFIIFFLFLNIIYANSTPSAVCNWLPWCWDFGLWNEKRLWSQGDFSFVVNIIRELMKYVSLMAVISVMIAGIMYMVSLWNDDKVEKVKKWLIWSLLWVLLSVSAWSIINLLNKFNIN